MKNTGASGIVNRSTILVFQYCKCTILVHPVLYIYDSGFPVLQHYHTGISSIVQIYNTGITSIVNITILVIPASRAAASYYPNRYCLHPSYDINIKLSTLGLITFDVCLI